MSIRPKGDEFVACIDMPTQARGRQTVLRLQRELNDGFTPAPP